MKNYTSRFLVHALFCLAFLLVVRIAPVQAQIFDPSPQLNLAVTGIEELFIAGVPKTRVSLSITNYGVLSDTLFAPAPYLPPCGSNPNSSRSWVEIYSVFSGRNPPPPAFLNGFCNLPSNEGLTGLWFVANSNQIPQKVVVVVTDRKLNKRYASTCINPISGQTLPC